VRDPHLTEAKRRVVLERSGQEALGSLSATEETLSSAMGDMSAFNLEEVGARLRANVHGMQSKVGELELALEQRTQAGGMAGASGSCSDSGPDFELLMPSSGAGTGTGTGGPVGAGEKDVELASLSQRVRLLAGENSYLQEREAELTTSLRHREESIRRQGVQATTDVARISRLMGEVEASKAAIEAARAKSGLAEGDLTSFKALFATLEDSVAGYRSESGQLMDSYRHAVKELNDSMNALAFYKALATRKDSTQAQLVTRMTAQDAQLHTLQGIVPGVAAYDRTRTYTQLTCTLPLTDRLTHSLTYALTCGSLGHTASQTERHAGTHRRLHTG